MVLEYSGTDLALIELSTSLKLCSTFRWSPACSRPGASRPPTPRCRRSPSASPPIWPSLRSAAFCSDCSKRRSPDAVFRVPEFLGAALMLGLLATLLGFVPGASMSRIALDVAHLLAGTLVLISFSSSIQTPLCAAAERICGARLRGRRLGRLAGLRSGRAAPLCHRGDRARRSRRSSFRLPCTGSSSSSAFIAKSRRSVGVGIAMLAGIGLVALSMVVMLRVTTAPIRWRARISPSRSRWYCSGS